MQAIFKSFRSCCFSSTLLETMVGCRWSEKCKLLLFCLLVLFRFFQQRTLSQHLWARQKIKAYGWLSNWINSKAHIPPKLLLSAPGQSLGAPHPSAENHSLYLFVFSFSSFPGYSCWREEVLQLPASGHLWDEGSSLAFPVTCLCPLGMNFLCK